MAEDNDESDDEPAVELGEGEPVEGAPLARVASRLTWPQQKSNIREKEGGTVIRTPDGPRDLDPILAEVETTYFAERREFIQAIRDVIGTGPIPTDRSAP